MLKNIKEQLLSELLEDTKPMLITILLEKQYLAATPWYK